MSHIRCKKLTSCLIEDEPPLKKLTSEGDLLIKKLLKKQSQTTVSLYKQLHQPKQFLKGAEVAPLSQYFSGTSTLSEIICSTQRFNSVENLKTAGLTDYDAKLYLDSLNGFEFVANRHKNWEKKLLKEHVNYLQKAVERHNSAANVTMEKTFQCKGEEAELSVKPNSIETKLLKFALSNQNSTKFTLPSHPINNIVNIQQNLFKHLNNQPIPSLNRIRHKARKLRNRINLQQCTLNSAITVPYVGTSKWDVTAECEEHMPTYIKKEIHSSTLPNYYTIKDGIIIKISEIRESDKFNSKLTLEEIKQLPKQKDYSIGVPSKVLYIKNLNTNINEEDLQLLFTDFGKSITEYKVMHGKLRGQAFVTFLGKSLTYFILKQFKYFGTF
ncbi:hypothetical protein FQA39_LY14695 [Lamprigera yunnana]|nr:hypothetical protein FQA39_LY14695 [Lamprigera yunnana]